MSNDQKQSGQVDKVRAVFDEWAGLGRAEGMERGHSPVARQAFEALDVGAGTRYLDVGCGNGYTVRWASERATEVSPLGIDVSSAMIERATSMSAGTAARFVRSEFPSASLVKDGPFDAIFSMEVFYYLPDLELALRSVQELLAPGGRFAMVIDYYEENEASHSWPDDLGVHMHRLSADGWRKAMEDAGLTVLEQRRLHPPMDQASEAWKLEEGSLFTLATRA